MASEKPLPLPRRIGQMLGTADIIAQMSDRCYLEEMEKNVRYAEQVAHAAPEAVPYPKDLVGL